MFLTILHMRYMRAMAEYALLLLVVAAAVIAWGTWVAGFSFFLVAAPVLPVVESAIRFRRTTPLAEQTAFAVGLAAALAHAVFLFLAQRGSVDGTLFAVICQYLSLLILGTALGCMLFTEKILAFREPKKAHVLGKGKGGYQRPRKNTIKKPKK